MTRSATRAWSALTRLLVVAVFAQSIFAGVLLSGEGSGRTAHGITALVLIAVTLGAASLPPSRFGAWAGTRAG